MRAALEASREELAQTLFETATGLSWTDQEDADLREKWQLCLDQATALWGAHRTPGDAPSSPSALTPPLTPDAAHLDGCRTLTAAAVLDLRRALTQARLDATLSVTDLATQIGADARTVETVEAPDGDPTLSTLGEYALGVGCLIEFIVEPVPAYAPTSDEPS